ncbi:predicted protein [Nematostella vectensis]|uniref:Uncharacterized protein n=1 Tax=Nematostella vectensis TaxID=45351 RepID=A7SVW0_NEMVE|nr:predicted protein [Nematostella vectensis]|eukprot:XP_001624249.1 predicted protein [Nematostella vectensis]
MISGAHLEDQVSDLKRRLGELRKAKSQTIVKKDKEYVTSDAPQLGQKTGVLSHDLDAYKEQIRELQGKLRQLEKEKAKGEEILKTDILQLKKQLSSQEKESQNSDYLRQLQEENQSLKDECEKLLVQNTDLKMRTDDLLEALSKKEAQWCEREEELKQEVKLSWREKYHEWMAMTGKKIEELQMANNFLRKIIDKGKPQS